MPRVGLIGYGAMSRAVCGILSQSAPDAQVCGVLARNSIDPDPDNRYVASVSELIARRPDVVLECAGHAAVAQAVPDILQAGIGTIVMSVGALADADLLARIQNIATQRRTRLVCATGAIGGLDALRSARLMGLTDVAYTGRKPPMAWAGTPAADTWNLASLTAETIIFRGDSRQAALSFPKNANVTAAVALSGVGFEKTTVTLIADPNISRNVHEISVTGSFGSLQLRLDNEPLPDNPRTSALSALNAAFLVRRELSGLDF